MEVGAKKVFGLAFVALALAQGVFAGETIRLRRGLVVPIRFQDELTLRENREGDRFTAIVQDDRELPRGAVFEGHIERLERAHDNRPGYMDLQFDALLLPDGNRERIDAVPIRMDDKTVKRDSEGRFTAKKKLEDTSKHVIGGMIGGYLIGRILGDKGTEGVMLGAVAGILMGESERNSSANEVVVKRDAKMGALFMREANIELDGDGRNDQRDRRDDRYEPRNTQDGRGIVIEYQERELRFDNEVQPYREGETWMVPLEATARQIGMSVDDSHSRRIYVEDDDTVLILEQDSRNYRLNGKRAELPRSITVKDDVVYVPIDALLAAKGTQIRINRTQR